MAKKTKKYGLLVDMTYCFGCGVCVAACKQENDLPPYMDDKPGTIGLSWNQVLSFSEGIYPELSVQYLPIHCMHCEKPPCVESCPKQAIHKREDGIVFIANNQCNACEDQPNGTKKCIPACPYEAISFNEEKRVAEACTLCLHRIEVGLEPACVRACIGGAIAFGDFNDPGSKASQALQAAKGRAFVLKPERDTVPSVWYISPEKFNKDKLSNIASGRIIYGSKK